MYLIIQQLAWAGFQTPLLAEIVKRERLIEQFTAEDFWTIRATFNNQGKVYEGEWFHEKENRIFKEEQAERLSELVCNQASTIMEMKEVTRTYQPPLLYCLSTLQMDAGSTFGFKPAETLKYAQSLYDKGYLSYPRTLSKKYYMDINECYTKVMN
ncbi:DNA topoisomerase [Alkalihalophilus marmarensis]|uniref:DNA topoisomerase n=1 Tax=Alkalihalophilus marmarensis TaxID=521377 RepID=UPI002DB645C8|nr:DNA topoisomerase [Alkalihalophilus marmarensis]MEC2074387.1 DNA topoisomerase [Alkalihalophilus marmarensis]